MGFTADGLPLVGRAPWAPGLTLAAGFNGGGFSWGSVAGAVIPDLLTERERPVGAPGYDLRPFRPDRFAEDGTDWANPFIAGERSRVDGVSILVTTASRSGARCKLFPLVRLDAPVRRPRAGRNKCRTVEHHPAARARQRARKRDLVRHVRVLGAAERAAGHGQHRRRQGTPYLPITGQLGEPIGGTRRERLDTPVVLEHHQTGRIRSLGVGGLPDEQPAAGALRKVQRNVMQEPQIFGSEEGLARRAIETQHASGFARARAESDQQFLLASEALHEAAPGETVTEISVRRFV